MDFSKIDTIIFDLGGVIINIDPERTYRAMADLAGWKWDAQRVKKFLHEENSYWENFELGKYDMPWFCQLMREEMYHHATDEQIEEAWCALLMDIPKERIDLIDKLGEKYELHLLSNTSIGHIPTVNKILKDTTGVEELEDLFVHTFYSYEMHMRKPDVAIYEKVIDKAYLMKEATLFVDDSPENIEGAKKAGLHTHLVTETDDILTIFKNA